MRDSKLDALGIDLVMDAAQPERISPQEGLADGIAADKLALFLNIPKPFSAHERWSDVVKHFTPAWFAMTMGTGITAICLNTLSTWLPWMHSVATGLWLLNIILFICFVLTLSIRSIMFPDSWVRMLKHPVQPMFLGCIPMGLVTIINGCILFAYPAMGESVITFATGLWWLDVGLSILSSLVVPYFMFTRQNQSLETMTAVWLLPFVACEVAASSGGLILPYLAPVHGLAVLVVSLVLWSISVSLALGILVIFFQRLCLHKLPTADVAASIWLPLGPTGTGALGLLLLGHNAIGLHAAMPDSIASMIQLMPGIGLLGGIVMWALATWWFIIALFATLYYAISKQLRFNLGFWAYTFPLGVYTLATVFIGKQTEMRFFIGFGALLAGCLAVIWAVVFVRTLHGGYSGKLIKDPSIVSH